MARARPTPPEPWTVEEFLAWEREQEERYEYAGGIIRMMVGGTLDHNTIALNVASRLRALLAGGSCRVFMEGVKVVSDAATMYPDVVVTCQPLAPDDDRVPDPTVVVGVLSPTTERHDRIAKWRQYQRIDSLEHFVLVEQAERRVEVYSRTEAGWALASIEPPEDAVVLQSIGAHLSLEAIYEDSGR